MAAIEELTLLCQGCGRKFNISQQEYDRMLTLDITKPIFCSTKCAMHGWDPVAIYLGRVRAQNAENKQ